MLKDVQIHEFFFLLKASCFIQSDLELFLIKHGFLLHFLTHVRTPRLSVSQHN